VVQTSYRSEIHVDEDKTASVEPAKAERKGRNSVWILTAVLTVVFMLVRVLPWNVRVIPVPEDDSWDLALQYFAAHHATCGLDYVFTFGPLGFIYNKTYFPDVFAAKLLLQGLLCSLTTAVLLLQGKRLFANPAWTFAWIFCIAALYGFFADVFFLAAPLLLLNQHFLLDDRKKAPSVESLILVFLTAMVAIVKFTFFVAAAWAIAFVAIDELFVKRSKPILTASFVAFSLGLWLISGQPLDALVNYITTSLQVTSGHSEAMSVVESPNWILPVSAAIASAALIFFSFSKLSWDRLRRGCAPALLAQAGLFF